MNHRSHSRHGGWHRPGRPDPATDGGYSLIEMILVVVILGILAAGTVLVVSGMSTEAAATGCLADRRHLHVAVGAHEAQTRQRTITASGTDHDRYERALVEGGFLRDVSTMHDLDASGAVTPEAGSGC